MNDTVRYINQEYGEYLKNFSYLAKKNYNLFKSGDILIGINRQNLKMEVNGIINKIEKNYLYIKVYNVQNKKTRLIYPESYYIFVYHREKTKESKFKKVLNDFIKKIEKK
tara:strand:+ start:283 stop:612 length:330 start_codon:yes stop_codon:yes gene_type:complete